MPAFQDLYVLGKGQKRPEDIDPWTQAIAHAVGKLGAINFFPWWAVIGEDPDYPIGPTLQLAHSCVIDRFELHPSRQLFFDVRPDTSLTSARTSWTYLVQVHGSSVGYAWNAASQNAARDLKVICSLLSLASGRIWRLRQLPQLARSLDGSPTQGPPMLPTHSMFFPEYLSREDNYGDPTLFEMPSWVNHAWTKLQIDHTLKQLIATYHESLILATQNHGSYSLLASVAIVEAIGNRAYKSCRRATNAR